MKKPSTVYPCPPATVSASSINSKETALSSTPAPNPMIRPNDRCARAVDEDDQSAEDQGDGADEPPEEGFSHQERPSGAGAPGVVR